MHPAGPARPGGIRSSGWSPDPFRALPRRLLWRRALHLPALAENGLFRHLHDCLVQLRGYYSTLHVIVLLAHMAMCRIKAVEQLQYQPPGELGKLLGLDRVPEVRCLRASWPP